MLEGYGLTETSAAATVNTLDAATRSAASDGRVPGASVRIADDGEILLKGRIVFRRLLEQPDAATADALRRRLVPHRRPRRRSTTRATCAITGRKKELIVTAGGKNVAPAVLEDRLRAHPLISQCMVVGDGKPFIAA